MEKIIHLIYVWVLIFYKISNRNYLTSSGNSALLKLQRDRHLGAIRIMETVVISQEELV